MLFTVLQYRQPIPVTRGAYLVDDNWNDYHFVTMFHLYFSDGTKIYELGEVKIATDGMAEGTRTVLPSTFEQLPRNYFSLGTDVKYYQSLRMLGPHVSTEILSALHDVALDQNRLAEVTQEPAFTTSLLRGIHLRTVTEQFFRIIRGGDVNTEYSFRYILPANTSTSGLISIDFSVKPNSLPPTNIHAIIGSNGAGKTRLLRRLGRAAVLDKSDDFGQFVDMTNAATYPFSNIVALGFSSFDQFEPLGAQTSIPYHRVGIHKPMPVNAPPIPRTSDELASIFQTSVFGFTGEAVERWRRAISTLRTDPLFEFVYEYAMTTDLPIVNTIAPHTPDPADIFNELSSGHKVVLLSITKLVELVTERTLVLIDEPETHLHPPLLSGFIRTVSNLLVERNGVAVIATHSPVVLQETPRECVTKLRRTGSVVTVERPEIETFGENVGTLTREAFGLEVTRSGFHQLIKAAVADNLSFDQILDLFGDQIGSEGMAIARTLVTIRDN